MTDELKDVVASNVNEEAVVLFGSTTGELMSMAVISVAIVIPVAVVTGIIMDRLPLFVSLSLVVVFAVMAVVSRIMQVMKRGRPPGYFQHRMLILKGQFGLKRPPFVREHGVMSTIRTRQCILVHKHLRQGGLEDA